MDIDFDGFADVPPNAAVTGRCERHEPRSGALRVRHLDDWPRSFYDPIRAQ